MCIIAYVKNGKDLTDERIRFMFGKNPDGAGLMWKPTKESEVEIRKGFMTVEELIKAYRSVPKGCERAIHMRIATAGKISVDCCHPFPVRKSVDLMRNAKDRTDVALMHNGIISYCQPKGGMGATYSDSMLFAATYLYHFKNLLDDGLLQELMEHSTPSRLLIMRKGQPTIMVGDWHEDENGVLYSNSGYKPITYTYSTSKWYSDCWKGKPTTEPKVNHCNSKDIKTALDWDWDYEAEFDIDVSQYFNKALDDGYAFEDIEADISDAIYDDIFGMDVDGYCPEVDDILWRETAKCLTVRTWGLPISTKKIAGFNIIASRKYPLRFKK